MPPPWPLFGHLLSRPRSAGRPRPAPPVSGEQHGPVAGEPGPGRGRDRLRLRDQRSSRREIATPDRDNRHPIHRMRQLGQQARLASGPDMADLDHVPALVVQHHARRHHGRYRPPQPLLAGDLFVGKDPRCPAQQGCTASARPSVTSTTSPSDRRSDGPGTPAGGLAGRPGRPRAARRRPRTALRSPRRATRPDRCGGRTRHPAAQAAGRTDAGRRTPAPSPIPPAARATRIPAAAPAAYSSSADLPPAHPYRQRPRTDRTSPSSRSSATRSR